VGYAICIFVNKKVINFVLFQKVEVKLQRVEPNQQLMEPNQQMMEPCWILSSTPQCRIRKMFKKSRIPNMTALLFKQKNLPSNMTPHLETVYQSNIKT